LRRMLPPLAVACRYHFDRGNPIPFRIKAGMMLSTLKVYADDCVGVFRDRRTNRNCRWVWDFAHAKSIAGDAGTISLWLRKTLLKRRLNVAPRIAHRRAIRRRTLALCLT
jgi:hypothetical protein